MEREIQKLKEIKGEVSGVVFKTDRHFIEREKGKEGLRLVEEETKKMSWPIEYAKIRTFGWYPLGQRVVSLLATKRAFKWTDARIREMGSSAPLHSFMIKLMAKYFINLETAMEKAKDGWKRHYNVGELFPAKIDKKEKVAAIRVENFKVHPILCQVYLEGYFLGAFGLVIKSRKVTCQSTKCEFKGDPYHQYTIKWE